MPVFSGNEEKRLGTERRWQKKKKKLSLPHSSFLSSSWFTYLLLLLIPTETNYFLRFYPFLVPYIYRKRATKIEWQGERKRCCVFPLDFHFSSQPALTFCLPQVYLCCFLLSSVFKGPEIELKLRVWVHVDYRRRNIMEGVKHSCRIFVFYIILSYSHRSLINPQCSHNEWVLSMMINRTPRKKKW